jgi:diguanylate cyclase (GGDEF)-like protein
VAERLRQRIAEVPFITSAGALQLTIRVGVAEASGATYELSALLDQADRALYRAKQAGRNYIMVG